MLYPKDAEFIIETRNALDSGTLPGPLAGLIGDYMKRMDVTTEQELHGTLYLNVSCPLVRQLVETPPPDAVRCAILTVIYQFARLFAGRTMTPADVREAFGEAVQALGSLASQNRSTND